MRILVEGVWYPNKLLEELLPHRFFVRKGDRGVINHVGYYHNSEELIYLLPKVFIDTKGLFLSEVTTENLGNTNLFANKLLPSKTTEFISHLTVIFYKTIVEFKNRYKDTPILEKAETLLIKSNLGDKEFTYLDLILSLIAYYRKHKDTLLYIYLENKSNRHSKVSWATTIRKTQPLFNKFNQPIYIKVKNKRKEVDNEEELLSIFFSVINYLKETYSFNISVNNGVKILKGKAFNKLLETGYKQLKKIRYKYFSDTLLGMYKLLQAFFLRSSLGKQKSFKEEFILVRDYHIVFEDMIDKLLSDDFKEDKYNAELARELKHLKSQKDGKIIDHLFDYESLLTDTESLFYIGDSKYYKAGNPLDKKSIYKQFTYAKNITQYNIDLLNEDKNGATSKTRYRDSLTEGYSISPNFFILGRISDLDYRNHNLSRGAEFNGKVKEYESACHFKNRLFDRDTLYTHYYTINFLYVIKAYTISNKSIGKRFKDNCRSQFKKDLQKFFFKDSGYQFFERAFDSRAEIESYVIANFKKLNGKVYRFKNMPEKLILALQNDDDSHGLDLKVFEKFTF